MLLGGVFVHAVLQLWTARGAEEGVWPCRALAEVRLPMVHPGHLEPNGCPIHTAGGVH